MFPAGNVAVALEVDDALLGEPLVVRAMPVEPQDRVAVTLRPRSAGPGRSVQLTRGTNGWYEAVVEGLQADDYEVQVSSAGLHPVTEVASVVDPATFDPAPFDPQPPDRDR